MRLSGLWLLEMYVLVLNPPEMDYIIHDKWLKYWGHYFDYDHNTVILEKIFKMVIVIFRVEQLRTLLILIVVLSGLL